MKKNTNILSIIGLIVLVCGQLQGLTRRQFFELDQLKQKLNMRYDAGMPGMDQGDWLDENIKIIEKIRRLDRPTAATYQEQQDIFTETMQEQERIVQISQPGEELSEIAAIGGVEEQERIVRISKEAAQPIQDKIKALEGNIRAELLNSPHTYSYVNFKSIPQKILELKKEIRSAKARLTKANLLDLMTQQSIKLPIQLANAVLTNVTRLAEPIIKQVNGVKDYIEKLQKSNNPFNFDEKQIGGSIINEISSRLDSAYQEGLLLNPHFINLAQGLVRRNAIKSTDTIADRIAKLLDEFIAYINKLNRLSQADKENNRLLKDHFNTTVQAILVMKKFYDLYAWLPSIFRGKVTLIEDLTRKIDERAQILLLLKVTLYDMYEVEEKAGGKMTILYDTSAIPFGNTERKRSGIQNDLLTVIPVK